MEKKEIKEVENYSKVVKDINFISRPGKKRKNYYLHIVLINGSATDIFMDPAEFEAIKVLQNLKGQAVKDKKIVRETSVEEETNVTKEYICVRVELMDGTIFRYFLGRAFEIVLKAVYEDYLQKQKVNK